MTRTIRTTDTLRRLAASLLTLALLLSGYVHPASAHGMAHHRAGSQDAGQVVTSEPDRSANPRPGHRCDGCLDCCAMADVALPDRPSTMAWLSHRSAIYGGTESRDTEGLGAAPATPPPRSNA